MDCSPPGSSFRVILQARILEWVAIPFSGGSSILVFTAALFTVARIGKQPRCPSADEWIKKIWYIHKMEYCSAIKRKVFESVLMRWMNVKPVIQNEVSQKDKNKHRLFFIAWIRILSFIPTIYTSSLPSRGQGAVVSGQRDRMWTTDMGWASHQGSYLPELPCSKLEPGLLDHVKVSLPKSDMAQSCPTLGDLLDYSSPGSSVHGILQARILERVDIPFCKGSCQPRDWAHISCVSCIGRWIPYHQHHPGRSEGRFIKAEVMKYFSQCIGLIYIFQTFKHILRVSLSVY